MDTIYGGSVQHTFDAPGEAALGMNDSFLHFNATSVDVYIPFMGGSAWLEWTSTGPFGTTTIHASPVVNADSGFGDSPSWFAFNVPGFEPGSTWVFRPCQGDGPTVSTESSADTLSGNGGVPSVTVS